MLPWRCRPCRPRFRRDLGQDATAGLLELLDRARDEWTPSVTDAATERFERGLTQEVSALRTEIRDLGTTLRGEIRELATTLRSEIKDGDNARRLEMRELGASLRVEMRNDSEANLILFAAQPARDHAPRGVIR